MGFTDITSEIGLTRMFPQKMRPFLPPAPC